MFTMLWACKEGNCLKVHTLLHMSVKLKKITHGNSRIKRYCQYHG